MPTYDYHCTACKHEFEEFQAMSAKALTKCPKCGKPKLERKIGIGAGVLFKGGGFYETDYRSDSYKKSADAESKSASTASDDPTKGKPDPKAETGAKPAADAKGVEKPAAASGPPSAPAGAKTPTQSQAPATSKRSKPSGPRR